MVSARVLNPVLSEFCKMTASPGVSRNLPYGRQLERIKRNLFGPTPTNLMETKTSSSFNAELERHQEMATQKWGFDFRTDRPLSANGSFIWERVSSQESTFAPQMYTLTRAAHVRNDVNASAMPSDMDTLLNERADRENLANSSLDSNTDTDYDSQNESLPLVASTSAAALTASSSSSTCNYSTQQRKRQLKITEFMKERKRLAQAPKKISPAKRMRTSSGSGSSSSSSLGAQFGCLLKRSRNDN